MVSKIVTLLFIPFVFAAYQDFDEDAPPPGFEAHHRESAEPDPYAFARMMEQAFYSPQRAYYAPPPGYCPFMPAYQQSTPAPMGEKISLDELFDSANGPCAPACEPIKTAFSAPTPSEPSINSSSSSSFMPKQAKGEFKSKEEVQQSKRGRKKMPRTLIAKKVTLDELLSEPFMPNAPLEKPFIPGLEHVVDLLDPEDYPLVSKGIDPRDIAYAYLMIGERAFTNILCLMANYWQVGDLLKNNIDEFRKAMDDKYEADPDAFELMLKKCTGATASEFFVAVDMYKRRLRFAHPKKFFGQVQAEDPARRRHLKYLFSAPSTVGFKIPVAAVKAVKQRSKINVGDLSAIQAKALVIKPLHSRPGILPAASTIDVVLAVLYAQEFYPTDSLALLRKTLAHYQGSDNLYKAYVEYVLADHPYRQFLAKLENIDKFTQ